MRENRENIEEGFMVFTADGELGVAAVREVRSGELVINIQNAGDFVVPIGAVRDVHSQKVVLDVDRLEPRVREALKHVHEREDPYYEATDPEDGALHDT